MKNLRFWVGTGVLTAACVLVILATAPGYYITSSGKVEGRVNYNGRPLAGGVILFLTDDPMQSDSARAFIDEQGHYEIDPSEWRREGPERTLFRISVTPAPAKHPNTPSPAKEGGSAQPATGSPGDKVVPVAMASAGPAVPSPDQGPAASGLPQRFTNAFTSGLVVQLGREPARIDFDLKD